MSGTTPIVCGVQGERLTGAAGSPAGRPAGRTASSLVGLFGLDLAGRAPFATTTPLYRGHVAPDFEQRELSRAPRPPEANLRRRSRARTRPDN